MRIDVKKEVSIVLMVLADSNLDAEFTLLDPQVVARRCRSRTKATRPTRHLN